MYCAFKFNLKAENAEILTKAIKYAVNIGYRHFDLAWLYNNEDVIGAALRSAIEESNGKLKREDFFLVSKCWNTFHSKGKIFIKNFEMILKRINIFQNYSRPSKRMLESVISKTWIRLY